MPQHPERLPGFTYTGPSRYFLTFCTHERRRYFVVAENVSLVREQFLRAAHEQQFVAIAYCFMPDHVHLVVEGQHDDADLRRFINAAKQYAGFHFQQQRGQRLWQRYSYEHVLRADETTREVVRYTIANPVRARIVETPQAYEFWGSSVYSREELLEYIQSQSGGDRSESTDDWSG